ATQLVVTEKSEVSDFVKFERFALDRSTLQSITHSYIAGTIPDPAQHAIAVNASNEVAFFYQPQATSSFRVYGMTLERYSSAGMLIATIDRPAAATGLSDEVGLDIADIAIANDGRIAIGGRFFDVQSLTGIVGVFP